MPINLDVSEADIEQLKIVPGARIALVDGRDDAPLAIITVEDIYKPDLVHEAIQVFGADDPAHPAVTYLRTKVKPYYVGGKVQAIQAPTHYDYVSLRCEYLPSFCPSDCRIQCYPDVFTSLANTPSDQEGSFS